MQFDRMVGNIRVVNAGSVGMPFGESGADWLLLDGAARFQHTSYNLTQAAARILRTNYPQAEAFAANHILHPPSDVEMLEAFTRAGLS